MATNLTLNAYAAEVAADPREHCQHCGRKFTPGDICRAESIGRPLGRSRCQNAGDAAARRDRTRELAQAELAAAMARQDRADETYRIAVQTARMLRRMEATRSPDVSDTLRAEWGRAAAAYEARAARAQVARDAAAAQAEQWAELFIANQDNC